MSRPTVVAQRWAKLRSQPSLQEPSKQALFHKTPVHVPALSNEKLRSRIGEFCGLVAVQLDPDPRLSRETIG